jgi:hypothetical protein
MDVKKALEKVGLNATLHTWLSVHGYLCLALRHPGIPAGPARELVEDFVKKLGRVCVATGLLTELELRLAENVEQEEKEKIQKTAEN